MRLKVLTALGGVVLLLASVAALVLDWNQVTDTEMAPSLLVGDWLLIGPGTPEIGRVVALEDPAWPGRTIYRRVLGTEGKEVGLVDGLVAAEGRRLSIKEMGRDEHSLYLAENNRWLIRASLSRVRLQRDPSVVPPDHLYLLADDRIAALDSRWWGNVPTSRVEGVVWLRFGDEGTWRGRLARWAIDGPWEKPKPKPVSPPG